MQFYFALFILRTDFGYNAFTMLGNKITEFLEGADARYKFYFGEDYVSHLFVVKVLVVTVIFSSIMSFMCYLGVMQFIINYIARFLAFCLKTTPAESTIAAGSIFLGQAESPLMAGFIRNMTKSELHAVCTGRFATIAGSLLAGYLLLNIPAIHLLSASLMSVPASLAMSKLFYPETKQSKAITDVVYNIYTSTSNDMWKTVRNGAMDSIRSVANIAVNLIVWVVLVGFANTALNWFGHRTGFYEAEEVTFYVLCSYAFYPIAWLLGTDNTYCDIRKVAKLIGVKTFLNEFVAYADLSVLIQNTEMFNEYASNTTGLYNGTVITCDRVFLGNGTVLENGIITDRSIVLATYALSGFSNISVIGIQLGALSAMVAPSRKKDISNIVVRAMIAGNVTCFMTACIAGVLYQGPK